jgi:RNA polymerase sigma factor (sigma-70 family)
MSDWELIQEYVTRGSEDAFAALVERYANFVYSFCIRKLRDTHQAEESTQAVFIILSQKARELDEHTVMTGWLFKTAHYAVANALRIETRRRRLQQRAQDMAGARQSEEPKKSGEPAFAMLDEALEHLPENDRDVLFLKFYESRTAREIAAALRLSEGAVEMRLSRAIGRLHEYFCQRGVVLSVAGLASLLTASSTQTGPAGLAAALCRGAALGSSGNVPHGVRELARGIVKSMRWAKWKGIVYAAGVLALVTAGAIAADGLLGVNGVHPGNVPAAVTVVAPKNQSQSAPELNPPTVLPVRKAGELARFVCDSNHEALRSLTFFPDNIHLAAAYGGILQVWNINDTAAESRIVTLNRKLSLQNLAVLPDGLRAISTGDADICLWDLKSGGELKRTQFGDANSLFVKMSVAADGHRAVLTLIPVNHATGVAVLKTWGVDDWKESASGTPAVIPFMGNLSLDARGEQALLADGTGKFGLWDVMRAVNVTAWAASVADPQSYTTGNGALSPDGKSAAISRLPDRMVRLVKSADGAEIRVMADSVLTLPDTKQFLPQLIFSPDGACLAGFVPFADLSVRVWEVKSGKLLSTIQGHAKPVESLIFSPDGHSTASADTSGQIIVWGLPSAGAAVSSSGK